MEKTNDFHTELKNIIKLHSILQDKLNRKNQAGKDAASRWRPYASQEEIEYIKLNPKAKFRWKLFYVLLYIAFLFALGYYLYVAYPVGITYQQVAWFFVGIFLFIAGTGFVLCSYSNTLENIAKKTKRDPKWIAVQNEIYEEYNQAVKDYDKAKQIFDLAMTYMPPNYRKYDIVLFLDKAVRNGLVDNMKEGILYYENVQHKERVERELKTMKQELRQDIQNLEASQRRNAAITAYLITESRDIR